MISQFSILRLTFLRILNSEIILKTFTHVYDVSVLSRFTLYLNKILFTLKDVLTLCVKMRLPYPSTAICVNVSISEARIIFIYV